MSRKLVVGLAFALFASGTSAVIAPDDLTGAYAISSSSFIDATTFEFGFDPALGNPPKVDANPTSATQSSATSNMLGTILTNSASSAAFPDATGMNGAVGAESHATSSSSSIIGEAATGVWLGDFEALGTGALTFTLNTTGYLTLWDSTAGTNVDGTSVDLLEVGVQTRFIAITDAEPAGVVLYEASATLTNTDGTGAPGLTPAFTGAWSSNMDGAISDTPSAGITADKILDKTGMLVDDPMGSDCDEIEMTSDPEMPHCSFAFLLADMIMLDVVVGETFSLFLETGTEILGVGEDYMMTAAFNDTTGMNITGGPGVLRIESELAMVPVPASVALMIFGLLSIGAASRRRSKRLSTATEN
jgi:hypothetical protein